MRGGSQSHLLLSLLFPLHLSPSPRHISTSLVCPQIRLLPFLIVINNSERAMPIFLFSPLSLRNAIVFLRESLVLLAPTLDRDSFETLLQCYRWCRQRRKLRVLRNLARLAVLVSSFLFLSFLARCLTRRCRGTPPRAHVDRVSSSRTHRKQKCCD